MKSVKSVHEGQRADTIIEQEVPLRKRKNHEILVTSCLEDSVGKTKHGKSSSKRVTAANEMFRICQAALLSICVLLMSYRGIRYGQAEYSVLESGQIVEGYVHKAVLTLRLGNSVPYSIVSFVSAGMLVYSLVSEKPRWSLPSIVLYLTDLVCDVSDAVVAVWLFFAKFPFFTAMLYAAGTAFLIFGETWVWLGALRLYEHRTFEK